MRRVLVGRLSLLALALFTVACPEPRDRTPFTPPPPPPPPPPVVMDEVHLAIQGYSHPVELAGERAPSGRRFLQVELTLENATSATPIPAGFSAFEVVTVAGATHDADRTPSTSNPCTETTLVLHANRTCSLGFELAAEAVPSELAYQSATRRYAASFSGVDAPPMLCAEAEPESTPAACADGCNNDGDPYLDCDDADCCRVRTNCPVGTYCGGSVGDCTCDDLDCCDRIPCGPETVCGQQPDPFMGSLVLDDSTIASVDSGALPGGSTPCRAPVLVTVEFVRDGDTVEVSGDLNGPVRMIGVDTPEVGHNGDPSDCYGDEASTFTQQLRGHRVWLTFDEECKDQYDRDLAYVHLGADSSDLFQRQLLRRGFARTLTVRPNDALEQLFDTDRTIAASEEVGLWGVCQ